MVGVEVGHSVEIHNNVRVSVDWISFTVFDVPSVEELVVLLGYDMQNFTLMPKGGNGYKSMIKAEGYPLCILYDGNEDMGMHVTISGSAISDALSHFEHTLNGSTPFGTDAVLLNDLTNTVMIEFLMMVRRMGQLSRLDIAVDDIGGNYYSTADLVEILERKECVSKFRNWKNLCEKTLAGECTGHTVYLGSRTSDIMMRVYDKRLEQNKKLKSQDKPLIEYEWYRWELECKDERANRVADLLIDGKNLGHMVTAILNNYFRVINLDNNNRSRCSTTDTWMQFLQTIDKLGLYVAVSARTLKDKRDWIIRQVLPTLTGVIIADGGCFDIITNNLVTSVDRMSKEMCNIVTDANPTWQFDFFGLT